MRCTSLPLYPPHAPRLPSPPTKKKQLGLGGTTVEAMLSSLHHHHSSSSLDTDNGNNNGNKSGTSGGGVFAAAVPSARDLVLACADLLQRGDLQAARRAAGVLLSTSSPRADAAADRLAYHFARALALRADVRAAAGRGVAPGLVAAAAQPASSAAYLAFNQIAPFLRFAHLTANQAILDAVEGARRIHILDLDAAYGVQWPPLLQAIAERADPAVGPPEVRITGAGADRDTLLRTGSRLGAFARSIQLPFRFTPLLLSSAATHHHQQQVASASTTTTTTSSAPTSLEC